MACNHWLSDSGGRLVTAGAFRCFFVIIVFAYPQRPRAYLANLPTASGQDRRRVPAGYSFPNSVPMNTDDRTAEHRVFMGDGGGLKAYRPEAAHTIMYAGAVCQTADTVRIL